MLSSISSCLRLNAPISSVKEDSSLEILSSNPESEVVIRFLSFFRFCLSFETYSEVMDAWDDYQKVKIEKVLFLENGKFGKKS